MTQEQKNVIIPGVAVNTSTSTFPAPVGIGSSDPQSVLHIFSAAPVVKVEDSAAGTTASPNIQFLASNGTMGFVGYTGSGMQLLNAMNTSLVISTNNLERVRITQSGSMGIGMTAPTTALGVSGSGSFSGIVSASGISAVGATFAGNISVGGIMVGRGGGNQTTNVAIGLNALQLQTGSNNTAVGSDALANAVGVNGNVAVGMDSLRYIVSGTNNTAIGVYSQGLIPLTVSQQPSYNTSVGASSLSFNQTGQYNVALGSQALQTCTAGSQNTAVGYQTLLNNWASNNIAVGAQAMRSNKKGTDNVALGVMALFGNTAGNWNVAIGSDALYNNIANGNLAIGYGALYTNVASNQNIAIGHQTLYSNQTGAFNVAMGFRALQGNTSGSSNTAVGDQALTKNKSGNSNTAIGSQALYENLTGYSNVGVGSDALVNNTTGYRNTAIGSQALYENLIGYQNTAVGTESMFACEAGVNNIALGYQALYGTTGGAQNIAIGVQALYANAASYNLAIGHGALFVNDKGTGNVAVGHYALYGNTNGGSNTAIGHGAMQSNKSGNSNSAVGYYSMLMNDTGINNTALGMNTLRSLTSGSFNVAIGNAALYFNTASNNTAVGEGSLYKNTTGGSNTSVGKDSLTSNISGGNNSALGVNALRGNSGGSDNTAIGVNSLLANISGGSNSALGFSALVGNSGGNYNTAIGRAALANNYDSSNNTGIGYAALHGNTAGGDSTAVGYQAGYSPTTLGTIVRGVFIGANSIGANPASSTDEIVIGAGATGKGNNTAVIGKSDQTAATIYGVVTASLGVTAPRMFTASLTASALHVTGFTTLAGVTAESLFVSVGITAQKILATKLSVGATTSINFQDTLTVTPPFSEAPQGIGFYSAENLLRNGNFPNTTVGGVAEGWTVYGYAGASDTTIAGTASWAAAVGGSGPRGVAAVVLQCSNGGGAYQTVNLTPGAVYTVSARIRVTILNHGDLSGARFAIGIPESSTGISDAIVDVNLHDIGNSVNKWCYCSKTFTVPASALLTTPILVGVRSLGTTHSIQVTDIALYKGGIAKVFSPITVQEDTQQVLIGGNIGVGGVTAPAARLHVKSAGEGLRLETTANVGNNYLTFYAGSTIKSYIGQNSTNDDLYVINVANNPLYLGTNNSIDLAILADGNVGIGTTIPVAKLHITTPNIEVSTLAEMNYLSKYSLVLDGTTANGSNNTPMFNGSGIAFKGSSPTLPFASIFYGGDGSGGSLHFATSSSYSQGLNKINMSMRNGNVGIGITGPTVALDVVGGIKASTTLNVAGVATLAGVTAQSLWVSGGVTAATVSATTFTGALVGNAATATTLKDPAFNRITNPAGGYFENNTSSTMTGAIKVTLPVTWTNTMMRIKISVYDYSGRKSFDVVCGGYNYVGSSQWVNTFAYIEGDGGTTTDINYNIRFGHDGTKCAIWIGEALSSQWTAYGPKVAITEVMAGHSAGVDLSTGWVISIDSVTPLTVNSTLIPGLRSCAIAPTQAFHLANKAYVDGISEVPTANNASYTKLPNGTLMQWGRTPSVNANASATVTFPTAFSATCLPVVTTTTVGIQTTGILTSCHAAATSTAVTVHNNYSAAAVIEWIAMGY